MKTIFLGKVNHTRLQPVNHILYYKRFMHDIIYRT